MDARLGVIWIGLLGSAEFTDVASTALDKARGAIEMMPVTQSIIVANGIARLALLKLLLVVAVAMALLITFRWSRRSRFGLAAHRFVLNGCRITAVAGALVSLHNALLF
jgi:hypothetical protein